jgi:hypothetical protein
MRIGESTIVPVAEARERPSGANAMCITAAECPFKLNRSRRAARSQRRISEERHRALMNSTTVAITQRASGRIRDGHREGFTAPDPDS